MYEAYVDNQSGFTGSRIVPHYMEEGLEDFQQYHLNTNQLAIAIGQGFNISPIKLEYVLNGYGGTIRRIPSKLNRWHSKACYWQGHHTPRIDQLPLLKRVLGSEIGGGVQQDFYELRDKKQSHWQPSQTQRTRLFDEYEHFEKEQ